MSKVSAAEGPVVVTGASGFVGSHVVAALIRKGYDVRACVTDRSSGDRTGHLLAMNEVSGPGRVDLFEANLLTEASYDSAISGCVAVFHAGTPMSHHGRTNREVFDGSLEGARNVLSSVKRAGTVKRFIYTSSMAAVIHPSADEYVFTEEDWAYALPSWLLPPGMASAAWDDAGLEANGYVSYGMAKVATERLVFATAAEDGRFDTVSVQPSRVLGPLLSPIHHIPESWQETVGKLLQGQPATDGWWSRWNIVDVRDVAEAQARIAESDVSHNGERYLLTASDSAGELSVPELQEHLQRLFPGYNVAGAPKEYASFLQARGGALPNHHAFRNKAERDLGLAPRPVDETLRDTARSLIDLGVITPALLAR